MSSRDEILSAVRRNKPAATPLPEVLRVDGAPAGGAVSPSVPGGHVPRPSSAADAPSSAADAPPPAIPEPYGGDARLVEAFGSVLRQIGGRLVDVERGGVAQAVHGSYPEANVIASAAPEWVPGNVDLSQVTDPRDLARVDLFVCEAELGVVENGAVWLPESRIVHRAAPFIAEHLAVVLDRSRLVWNMHQAYERLRCDQDGYGVFVAGPSKTADIEQSLVIGAHGPRSLTLLLL